MHRRCRRRRRRSEQGVDDGVTERRRRRCGRPARWDAGRPLRQETATRPGSEGVRVRSGSHPILHGRFTRCRQAAKRVPRSYRRSMSSQCPMGVFKVIQRATVVRYDWRIGDGDQRRRNISSDPCTTNYADWSVALFIADPKTLRSTKTSDWAATDSGTPAKSEIGNQRPSASGAMQINAMAMSIQMTATQARNIWRSEFTLDRKYLQAGREPPPYPAWSAAQRAGTGRILRIARPTVDAASSHANPFAYR